MENVLEVSIIVLTLSYSLVLFSDMKSAAHLGSIAVFLSWIELTLLLGRFPTMGIYIYMSFHVCTTIASLNCKNYTIMYVLYSIF